MKKLFLTLIVTMLTCIGAWAQDETVILQGGQSELTASDVQALNLEEDHILKLYYRNQNSSWGYIALRYPSDQWGNTQELFNNNSQIYWKESFGDDDWGVVSYTLTGADVDKLNAGIKIDVNQVTFGKLTLTKPVYEDATSVSISNSELTLEFGASETLTASVAPEGAKQGIIWSATDGTGSVTVDQNGKVTAVAAGTATVRATAKSNAEIYAECTVTVNAPVGISSFTISSDDVNLLKGNKTTLTVTILPDNAADKTVTWSSDNNSVATVNNGEITAVGRGSATITATSASINGADPLTATATVTVKENLVPTSSDLKTSYLVGDVYTPAIALSDAGLGTIAYTSDNTEVISIVDGNINALKAGNANITVTITPSSTAIADNYTDTPWTKTFAVTVAKPAFGLTLTASPSTVQLGEGGTVNVTPVVTLNGSDTDNTDYTITYALEGASSDITINEETGAVTVPSTATTQQFNIVATLAPTEATLYDGATAKAKVLVADKNATVTISVDANGVYTVNVPYGGAFGTGNLNTDPTSGDDAPALLLGDATLAGLKAATTVKVTGLIANRDVQELVYLIGGASSKCKSFDMGGATMTEAITNHDVYSKKACTLVGGSVDYGYGIWPSNNSLENIESLVLPNPALGVTGGTILPANMQTLYANWDNISNNKLQSLVIPEGWTKVEDGFSGYFGRDNVSLEHLTSLSLPNSLEYIGQYAFSGTSVNTLYMPKSLKVIDKGAFNTASKLSDVYFTGPAPIFVHTEAFGADTQQTNNTVDDNDFNGKYDPTTTRDRYSVGSGDAKVLACIMHYPADYKHDYIDETRVYQFQDPTIPYGKGNQNDDNKTSFIPEGWTQSFIDEVNSHRTESATYLALLYVDCGIKDATYGASFPWPSQGMMTSGYTIAHAGYTWAAQKMDESFQYNPEATPTNGLVDRRGLYQFIVAMPNAPKDKDKWVFPQTYEQNKWYTFSVPFDMSVEQIRNVFGPTTQVCRISKVIRDTSAEPNVLRLEFRKSVMQEGFSEEDDILYADGVRQAGIRHHYPYMIKPSGITEEKNGEFYEDGHRILPDYKTIPGTLNIETVTAVTEKGASTGKEYMFCPILMEGKLKKNSYVLTNQGGVHKFIFYKGTKVKDENGEYVVDEDGKYVYADGSKASANTAYVQLLHGQDDSDDFFPSASIEGNVKFASYFGDVFDVEDEATRIEKVEIVCGDENSSDDVIYSINGIRVKGESLAPGLYVKNGKKYIVK